MKIRKTYQGVVPNGKVLNSNSSSVIDTYSCDYINKFDEKVLFDGIGGNTNDSYTITLNDSINNYKYIEIFFRERTNNGGYIKLRKEDCGSFALSLNFNADYFTFMFSANASISDKTLSVEAAKRIVINRNNNTITNQDTSSTIYKVVGYK